MYIHFPDTQNARAPGCGSRVVMRHGGAARHPRRPLNTIYSILYVL